MRRRTDHFFGKVRGGFIMKTFKLSLNSIEKVSEFIKRISKYDGCMDIAAGRYSVDARSLMGILSIDLNRVLELRVPSDYQCLDALQKDIQPFLA